MSVVNDCARRGVLGLFKSENRLFGIDAKALVELTPIDKLQPLLSNLPEVLGSITLRGRVIPVLDPKALCGLPPRQVAPRIAAVIWNDTSMAAIAVDEIIELRHYSLDELQKIEGKARDPIICGQIPMEAGTANILDIDAVFDRYDLPRAQRPQRTHLRKDQGGLIPHLTFQSGGVEYAVNVKNIFNTVHRRSIEDVNIASGPFLGNISYLKRRIPVVETNVIMNICAPRQNLLPEIVVLSVDKKRLLGLAVDQILKISYFEKSGLSPLPDHLRSSVPFIESTFTGPKVDGNILVLDVGAIKKTPFINELADLSKEENSKTALEISVSESEKITFSNVIQESLRNLVFFAGREFATPVHSILNIIDSPQGVIPWQARVAGVIGLFPFEGAMVPLLDLAEHLGNLSSEDNTKKKVLITGNQARKIGFLVDQITGLSTSNWRTNPDLAAPEPYEMVQIQEWPKNRIVSRIDLCALSETLSEQFANPVDDVTCLVVTI
jgi:purine-binding chemotaxis protein CheW